MPRWRRPSVIAARFARVPSAREPGSMRFHGTRPPRTFADRAAPGARAVARYDEVVVIDRPNEAYGMPQAILRAGDEVAILERDDVWIRVATVDGQTGWVLSLTLEREARTLDAGLPDVGPAPVS